MFFPKFSGRRRSADSQAGMPRRAMRSAGPTANALFSLAVDQRIMIVPGSAGPTANSLFSWSVVQRIMIVPGNGHGARVYPFSDSPFSIIAKRYLHYSLFTIHYSLFSIHYFHSPPCRAFPFLESPVSYHLNYSLFTVPPHPARPALFPEYLISRSSTLIPSQRAVLPCVSGSGSLRGGHPPG